MNEYANISQEKFDEILNILVNKMSPSQILAIPGIYEILSEELNNEVLDYYDSEQDL